MLVTLHLHGVRGAGVARAIGRMALERRVLARSPGLRFAKLLGTGDGRTFTLRDADLHRWGMFAVWDGEEALRAYEARSGWTAVADETWCAEMAPQRWRGAWSGRDPFLGATAAGQGGTDDGRVAALTRARIRPSQWRAFWRAVPPVAASAAAAPGRLLAVGIGEAPLGLQGTFTLWSDEAAFAAFAYADEEHQRVVQLTRERGWYAEELFARLAVLRTRGTLAGEPR